MMTPDQQLIVVSLDVAAVGRRDWFFCLANFPNVRDGCSITVSVVLLGVTCLLARVGFSVRGCVPELIVGEMVPGFNISFKP